MFVSITPDVVFANIFAAGQKTTINMGDVNKYCNNIRETLPDCIEYISFEINDQSIKETAWVYKNLFRLRNSHEVEITLDCDSNAPADLAAFNERYDENIVQILTQAGRNL